MNPLILTLVTMGTGLAAYVLMPGFIEMLREGGAVGRNYRGDTVAVGGGFLILWLGSLGLFVNSPALNSMLSPVAAGLGFGFLGFLDDRVGSRAQSGVRGHLRALCRRHLTTGAIKALGGVAWGLALASVHRRPSDPRLMVIVDGLLMAGSANLLNLFDLRPGRAGKAFLAGVFAVLIGAGEITWPVLPFAGALIGYLSYDLRGRVTMGDTGANGLGAILGWAAVWGFARATRVLLLVLILIFHVWAEQVSLSQVIEGTPVLRFLDRWGRRQP